MILFLDTSALVKAYVRERGTDVVREQMRLIEAAHHLGLPAVNPEDAWHIHS